MGENPKGDGEELTADDLQLFRDPETKEITGGTIVLWTNYRHAPEWFADALHEARFGNDHGARRREILFAVTFAESYLIEWLITGPLQREFRAFREYVEPRDRRSVTERWKEIPRALRDAGIIDEVPYTGDEHGEEWDQLIRYRHGLVHGAASRPGTPGLEPGWLPYPTKSDLDQLEPGWAVRVVIERVRRLHAGSPDDPPDWLEDP